MFFDHYLESMRCRSFGTACALSQAQRDDLVISAKSANDKGLLTDTFNFFKLLEGAELYKRDNDITLIKNIPWAFPIRRLTGGRNTGSEQGP